MAIQDTLDPEATRAKTEAKKQWAEENLKQDWMDKPEWRRLASHYGVRLAPWHIPATQQPNKYVTNRLKVDAHEVKRAFGLESSGLKRFGELNPRTPMYVLQGLVLEMIRDGDLNSNLVNY